ncbi:hypothetical protein [Agrilactobacillus composti]|nr:hypothetical protein [Agrilactobacillus composti]
MSYAALSMYAAHPKYAAVWIHLTKSNPYDSQFWWLLDKSSHHPS